MNKPKSTYTLVLDVDEAAVVICGTVMISGNPRQKALAMMALAMNPPESTKSAIKKIEDMTEFFNAEMEKGMTAEDLKAEEDALRGGLDAGLN